MVSSFLLASVGCFTKTGIEVRHFEVWDAGATTEKDFIGDVYLDLYPRGLLTTFPRVQNLTWTLPTENKYSHAAVWGLIPSYIKEDGSLQYPLAAMVANLAKPTPDRPALMRFACPIILRLDRAQGLII